MEARRIFMTGRGILPFEDAPHPIGVDPTLPGWRPLGEDDISLADCLSARGYQCGMVTDLWHLFKPTMNLHRSFHTWQFIRGQEADQWLTAPLSRFDPRKHIPEHLHGGENFDRRMRQYLQNTDWWRSEEDYFAASTMRAAVKWLETCRDRAPFFLYVDTFDPHEPFDPPKQYAEMYCDKMPCDRPLWGYGVNAGKTRPEDLPWIKGCYAGEVSFVDTWVGHLLEAIDNMGLAKDTVVAFTADHGTEFMEHGKMMKSPQQLYANITRPAAHRPRAGTGGAGGEEGRRADFRPRHRPDPSAPGRPDAARDDDRPGFLADGRGENGGDSRSPAHRLRPRRRGARP